MESRVYDTRIATRMMAVAAALVIGCEFSSGQIEIPRHTAFGNPITAKANLLSASTEAHVAYDWKATPGVSLRSCPSGPKTQYIWAVPGLHEISLVVSVADGDKLKIQRHVAEFSVGYSLRGLVPPGDAERLSAFYDDWSRAVASGGVRSMRVFLQSHAKARNSLALQNTDRAYREIDIRLAAIAAQGGPLVGYLRQQLASALSQISEELAINGPGPSPKPTPVVPPAEGQRSVLIVHEDEDDSTNFGGQVVKLRVGTSAEYLLAKGHTLQILSDDSLDMLGNKAPILTKHSSAIRKAGLPALLILDARTDKVLKTLRLGKGWTADNVIEYIRQTGG